jgi:hypothetical protein
MTSRKKRLPYLPNRLGDSMLVSDMARWATGLLPILIRWKNGKRGIFQFDSKANCLQVAVRKWKYWDFY